MGRLLSEVCPVQDGEFDLIMRFEKGHKGYWEGKKKSPMSPETKQKIRQALLGHPVSIETRCRIGEKTKGRAPTNLGIKWSDEVKKKISETNKRKGIEPKVKFVGFADKHPRWKGGLYGTERHAIMGLAEYKSWRMAVFKRDNFTCVWCGAKGVCLHADHIKEFALYQELRLSIDNGRTFCKACHKKRHADSSTNFEQEVKPKWASQT